MSRAKQKRSAPVHPGEILLEEFLNPMSISQYRLAKDIDMSARRIYEIVQGKRGISANTALRLGAYFSTSAEFWMNLQSRYDLEIEKTRRELIYYAQLKRAILPHEGNNQAMNYLPALAVRSDRRNSFKSSTIIR